MAEANGIVDEETRKERKSEIAPKLVQRVGSADQRLVEFVHERPWVALCTAAALGYLIGRIVTRYS